MASCPTSCCAEHGVLLGIGNPLLDISAVVEPALLQRYGLESDGAIMAEERHMPIYKELMDNYQTEFIAGGSVQNSLRVAQWILRRPRMCTYLGCVGNDDYARILKEKAIAEGVCVQYQVRGDTPTGTCAVLLTGTHRSLVANLAAAQKFTEDHLDTVECQKSIAAAHFIYTSGFFVASCPSALTRLSRHAHSRGLPFIMNLSAPFVSQYYQPILRDLMPYVDVLFGNETEADAFALAFDFDTKDLKQIALKMAAMPKLSDRKRVVVITQGCEPVILAEGDHLELIPVTELSREQIVDTNGAGDAFAGGFLSQLVQGRPYRTSVHCGIYAATHVIQHSGCTFSGVSDFNEQ